MTRTENKAKGKSLFATGGFVDYPGPASYLELLDDGAGVRTASFGGYDHTTQSYLPVTVGNDWFTLSAAGVPAFSGTFASLSATNLNCTNLDAGASGTAGSVDVFPATALKGKLSLACTDQTGNTTVTWNANAMGQATTINFADPGAAASYVVQSTAAITLAEADVLDGATAGTAVASKALVADANKDIVSLRNVGATNYDAGASGTAGTVDVFPATASKGKLVLSATDNTNDDAVTITNAAHGQATTVTIPDGGAATTYVAQSTAALTLAEVDVLDGATAGTQVASKAVVADANVNTGISKVTELHIGASGAETQVTATGAELNALDLTTGAGTSEASKALVLDANGELDGLPPMQSALVALSQSQLENLAATPVEVIAAASGKTHVVVGWRFRLIFNTTAFDDAAADGDLILKYAGGSTIDLIQADGLVDAAATTQGLSMNTTELIVAESGIDNTAVQIANDGGEFTVVGGGDSTAEVQVFYYTLDTNPS